MKAAQPTILLTVAVPVDAFRASRKAGMLHGACRDALWRAMEKAGEPDMEPVIPGCPVRQKKSVIKSPEPEELELVP